MKDHEFVDGVWRKYDNYLNIISKDKFFRRYKYHKMKLRRKLRTTCNLILSLLSMVGIVYAGCISHEIIQKSTKTDFEKNRGYDYNQNMIYNNSMYYKKIYTYEEYLEAQKIWDNLVDMKENDFEDSFVIILAGENYHTTSIYISNIYVKNEELYIELRKKDTWDINDTVISTKISKQLDRNKVNIINLPNQVNTEGQYVDIESLTEKYTIEEAIKDNCFVVKENVIVSNNKKQLDEFVNNCNNKIEDMIRIYVKETQRILIYDVEYRNNKINMVAKVFKSSNDRTIHKTGNRIDISRFDSCIIYTLCDEMNNGSTICSIKI